MTLIFAAIPVGTIAFLALQQVKKLSYTVDNLPPWAKKGAVALISLVLTSVFSWAKVDAVCTEGVNCLTELDAGTIEVIVQAALGSLVALLIHAKKK